MGIVNVTPDSFSDGNLHASVAAALTHCERLVDEGADILDIGGESTRPGSEPVPPHVELARVLPVLQTAVQLGVPISVDTYKPEVMQAALDAGVDIINDIWALRQPGALDVVAAHASCGVCLMHMHREPKTMQIAPLEGDVLTQVRDFLAERSGALLARGVAASRIVWDAGVGFGKTPQQNFRLLQRRGPLSPDHAELAGWSRKSSLGVVTGLPVHERLIPSVAAAVLAAERGARVLRVHDVKETVQALQVWNAASPPNLESV